MRNILLLALLPIAAACQVPGGQPNVDIGAVIRDTVDAVDKNDDGVITNREAKDSQGNVVLWTTVATALLALFGAGKAAQANSLAAKVEKETDEQWEALAKKA
jgi:hypothetical protein